MKFAEVPNIRLKTSLRRKQAWGLVGVTGAVLLLILECDTLEECRRNSLRDSEQLKVPEVLQLKILIESNLLRSTY